MSADTRGMGAARVKLAYRVNEACEVVGIGRSKLYELVESGEVETFKIGTRTLIRRDVLERLIDRYSGRTAGGEHIAA